MKTTATSPSTSPGHEFRGFMEMRGKTRDSIKSKLIKAIGRRIT